MAPSIASQFTTISEVGTTSNEEHNLRIGHENLFQSPQSILKVKETVGEAAGKQRSFFDIASLLNQKVSNFKLN